MTTEPNKINPYASPTLERESDFRSMLKAAREERRRRAAISMLIGFALFIVGVMLANASLSGGSDSRIFAKIGACLIASSLALFFAGPLLWNWLRSDCI